MHARFYAPALERGDSSVRLPVDEARHLLHVMRLRGGAPVRVFNGRGVECAGQVTAIERDLVDVALEREVQAAPEPRTAMTLVQALLKGDGFDEVVRDAVMLGVTSIVPVVSARIEGDRRGRAAALRAARWARIAVASAKQCGRAVVPDLAVPLSLADCLSQVSAADLRIVFVEPASASRIVALEDLRAQGAPASAAVFVGPEGGWSEDELRLLSGHGAVPVTLGRRTLRAEAAALVGLAALHAIWGEF